MTSFVHRTGASRGRIATGLVLGSSIASIAWGADWPTAGHDLANSRSQPAETAISNRTVGALTLKWSVATDGDVTANPTVDGGYLYFPDSAGSLYKVDRSTGAIVWKFPISRYTGIDGDFARASPAVAGNLLILGNQAGKYIAPDFSAFGHGDAARVFAVDKATGDPVWMTRVDPGLTMSFVTHSALIAKNTAYVGIASNEELISGFIPAAYGFTFSFRGSIVALDTATGAIKWKTYTVPAGYAGGAIWGSTGAADLKRNRLYIATGNNYAVPQPVLACLKGGGTPASCLDPADRFDSILALDLDTGAVAWTGRGLTYDAWNVGCGLDVPGVFTIPPNDNCPDPKGPDWDFAQGPMMFSDTSSGDLSLVGAGQKSGMFWTFRASDGKLVWATQAAPPGLTGGLQWGSATDSRKIFFAASNSGLTGSGTSPLPWKLMDGSTTTSGGWGALDAATGKPLWTTKDPVGSRAEGAVSLANGVVFGCNLAYGVGTMAALDAKTGKLLWSYNSGAMCGAGPSIADGMVYWGSGTFQGTGARKVFAFGL